MRKNPTTLLTSEHEEQTIAVAALKLKYPKLLFFQIPNGEHRNIAVAKRLKLEGLTPGVPDLFFPALRIFLEMKRKRNVRTQVGGAQRYIMKLLEEVGYTCVVAYGAQHAIDIISHKMDGRQPNGNIIQS